MCLETSYPLYFYILSVISFYHKVMFHSDFKYGIKNILNIILKADVTRSRGINDGKGMRGTTEVGNGEQGGHECSHGSVSPSYTVSHKIKCQTNQSSTKQTSIARAMMAFTSPGCISIKKRDIIQNWLSPNNLHTHTIKPEKSHRHSLCY